MTGRKKGGANFRLTACLAVLWLSGPGAALADRTATVLPPPAPQGGDPGRAVLRVKVAPDASLDQAARDLGAAAKGAGTPSCNFVWGDVGSLAPTAQPVRLQWAEPEHLDGWFISGADAKRLTEGRGIRQVGILRYREGRLRVSHLSGPGSQVLPDRVEGGDRLKERSERQKVFAIFDPSGAAGERDPRAADVLTALRGAPRWFRFVTWELDGP